jgi:hypothetical protein
MSWTDGSPSPKNASETATVTALHDDTWPSAIPIAKAGASCGP